MAFNLIKASAMPALRSSAAMATRFSSSTAAAAASAIPTVRDSLVNITFVDFRGNKHNVAALQGQNLLQVAKHHKLDFIVDDANGGGMPERLIHNEVWTEDKFGEGPQSNVAHVIIPETYHEILPAPAASEVELLESLPIHDHDSRSRLATEIVVSKEMEGMMVFVPEHPPIDMV